MKLSAFPKCPPTMAPPLMPALPSAPFQVVTFQIDAIFVSPKNSVRWKYFKFKEIILCPFTMQSFFNRWRESQMIPKGNQCCRGMQNNPRAAGTWSRGKDLPTKPGVSGLPLHGYKPEESQVKLLEFPRYKIDYRKGTFTPMITVPHPLVYHPSSPSWHGAAQLKIWMCSEAAHLGACALHTHTQRVQSSRC